MDFSGWIQLSSPDKKEEYGFIGNLNPKTISGTLSFRNAPLKRLPSIPVSGNVNGEALIWGELKNPDIRGKISLLKGEFNKSPLSFQGEFDIHDEGMTINNLRAEYKNHSLQGGKGVFVSKNGDFLFIGDYRGRLQNDSLSAQVEFRLKAGPVATKLDVLKVFQRDLSGSLRLNRFLFRGIDQKNWDFVYSKTGDSFKFKGGPENCIETELNKSGNFFLALKAPIPVAFSAKGNLKDKNIDATVSSLSVDISVLEFFVDIPFIHFTQGRGQGAVTLKGPVADPDINGFLNVDNLAFDVSIIPEKIAPFSTVISFLGKEMAIRRTAIKAGRGFSQLRSTLCWITGCPLPIRCV
jgi:autotransporter translocation and assembly factor TamB